MSKLQQKQLGLDALRAAMETRRKASIRLLDPVCVYDLAQELNVDVLFVDFPSFDGSYSKSPSPTITISSLRPSGRQAFTCAHELGHHIFDHGYHINEVEDNQSYNSQEFLANSFAGSLLMPKSAVQNGFTIRGWNLKTTTPIQMYTVAGWLGVGYSTLIRHMSDTLNILPKAYARQLDIIKPKGLREKILGYETSQNLYVVDFQWFGRAVDISVGDLVQLPVTVSGEKIGESYCLELINQTQEVSLFRGLSPGIARFYDQASDWATFVRVSPSNFIGRSIFRHLEDPDIV